MKTQTEHKILIGGKALNILGSKRHTDDTDYLVNDLSTKEMFLHTDDADYLNANGSKFFSELFEIEKDNQIASAQTLLELKVYAWIQHFQNMNFQKADDCEYDIKFLVRKYNLRKLYIVNKYIADFEKKEAISIIENVR